MSLGEECHLDFPQTEKLALEQGYSVCWWVGTWWCCCGLADHVSLIFLGVRDQ